MRSGRARTPCCIPATLHRCHSSGLCNGPRGALATCLSLYATIGNRDRRAPFQNAFASDGYLEGDIGFVQFAVNLGSLRIVAVDSLDDQSYLGAFSRSGRSTLNACLARAPSSQRSCFYIIPQLLHPVLLSNFVIRPGRPRSFAASTNAPISSACLLAMCTAPGLSRSEL
jgi:hypothetical protein